MRTRSSFRLTAVLILIAGTQALAAYEALPETWEARSKVRELILGPVSRISLAPGRAISQNTAPHDVRFTVEQRGRELFLLFLTPDGSGDYPLMRRGNTSVKRSLPGGELAYMTILLDDSAHSYIRLYPNADRTRMDVVRFGIPLHQRVPVPLPFERVIGESLDFVMELTEERVDWDDVLGTGRPSPAVERMVDIARDALPRLIDEEDGAFDRTGRPVLIETGEPSEGGLNCSGFAKWVVDGLYQPLTGGLLDIEELKEKHLRHRGNRWSLRLEEERDPFFGLDWSRNLAVLLHEARTGRRTDPEAHDVRNVPYVQYVEDVGFKTSDLELVLYLLALEDPDRFYVGSVNRQFGEAPVLHQHTHVVLFFPLFDADGGFRVVVMERNVETGLELLRSRYPREHVHLVSIRAGESFSPLTFPGAAD